MPRPAIPVLAGLFVGILFLAANVTAQHDPRPHGVPVAVAGEVGTLPPGYTAERYADVERAVKQRKAYGGIDAVRRVVYVAPANGYQASQTLEQVLRRLAPGAKVVDAVPLQSGDPRGLSLPQIVLGTIVGSFMMGVLTAQLALGEPLWQRMLAYLGFAVAFGGLAAVVIDPVLGVLTGHFAWVWLCAGATALAISLPVGALARLLGQRALPLSSLVFLILGNPSSGTPNPIEYLPGLFRAVGPFLPPNADATALLGRTYFDAAVLRPLLVLAAWIVVPGAVLAVVDRRRGSRRALAHDAAEAAGDTEDRSVQRGGERGAPVDAGR
jgi:hypothetical protein